MFSIKVDTLDIVNKVHLEPHFINIVVQYQNISDQLAPEPDQNETKQNNTD